MLIMKNHGIVFLNFCGNPDGAFGWSSSVIVVFPDPKVFSICIKQNVFG